jgi:hypothetical protein
MDIGAFVQENRKWLIGCGIGGLVFWIACITIRSVYDATSITSQMAQLRKSNQSDGVYDRTVLDAAKAESEQLAAEKLRLQQELAFQPSDKYKPDGKGVAPGEYLYIAGNKLKQGIIAAAADRDVTVVEKDVSWPVPTSVDEIRSVLFGLELLDELSQRLFAAHDAVRQKDPEAMGLRAVLSLKAEARTGQRASLRSNRPGEVVVSDHLVQEKVSFKFQADAATAAAFLETWRRPGRTLVLDTLQLQQPPDKVSDPVTINGTLFGIAFKETN